MKKLIFIITIFPTALIGFGQTPTFSSNFEDQNTTPEHGGSALIELSNGNIDIVANPNPDSRNSSAYVLRCQTSQWPARAEYTMSSRTPTVEKTYIYHWLRYHPEDMWTDITVGGGFVGYNQWKTWPCESCSFNEIYKWCDTAICGMCGNGIFNDFNYVSPTTGRYAARAEPNCVSDVIDVPLGRWNEYVLYIYWTTTYNGFWKLWRNDTLESYGTDMRTLMNYPAGFSFDATCGIRWSNGVYSSWQKSGAQSQDYLTAYVDDIAIYDIDDGYTIYDICPDCEEVPGGSTDINVNYDTNKLKIFPNPVNDNLFVNGETVPSIITIYSCDGRKVKYTENTNIVNISDLKTGIYIVLVNMKESFVIRKIIKE